MERPAMTARTHFLLAQYLPDVMRKEAKNIGVFVHSSEATAARFLGERPDKPTGYIGRVPGFVNSRGAYRQWVGYWRTLLIGDRFSTTERLLASSNGNYVVIDGGVLLDRVGADNVQDVADDLFENLVSASDEAKEATLEEKTRDSVTKSGAADDDNAYRDYRMTCPVEKS